PARSHRPRLGSGRRRLRPDGLLRHHRGRRQRLRVGGKLPARSAHTLQAVMALPAGVGVAADAGPRAYLEDRWAVAVTPGGLFAAVYDGHAGAEVADLAAADLHRAVLDALQAGHDPANALRQAFDRLARATDGLDCGSTAAALLLARPTLVTAHVGDSRI